MVTPDTEQVVSDAWLTTFGESRAFLENDKRSLHVSSYYTTRDENEMILSESENIGTLMDDSFNNSIYSSGNFKLKKDRSHDIRPGQFLLDDKRRTRGCSSC
ncbi:hypothetical protein KIN20_015690 [Parelaphostrongylus tenuis]|uniref:Uncharacterized protein n=1 Tax=Parelaphostrongylus tenuis TaxID=148309 RepID=A0AAD5QSM7_PARTN|nr:hypothetical protein KIN20_013795 [Parelaphostrongylus tenuis]KAJ1357521.1 hypothetical protein KIN20_015690 [Parelaphostrongylus tenuis]